MGFYGKFSVTFTTGDMRLLVQILLCLCLLNGSHSGKDERVWRKEEINWQHLQGLQKTEEGKLNMKVEANLNSVTLHVGNCKIWAEKFPPRRNKTNDSFLGNQGSIVVIVLKISREPTVMASRKFLTGQPTESGKLILFLKSLQKDRLVILIGTPNFLFQMKSEEREILHKIGSVFSNRISPNDSWLIAWITKGTRSATHRNNNKELVEHNLIRTEDYLHYLEKKNHKSDQILLPVKILVETVILKFESSPKSSTVSFYIDVPPQSQGCDWYKTAGMETQSEFCESFEGYDDLCSCHDPFNPSRRETPEPISMSEDIPIVIVTANKPYQLYRLIRNLEMVRGSAETKILVVVDGYHLETIRICRLFEVDVRVHNPQGYPKENTRTNMNIGFALWAAFDHFPDVTKVILLEDDLLLSPDLLSFFHQTSHLLDEDETLSHVNAFGQNSYPLTAKNLSTVLRVEMYPQYGWMTTRRWFQNITSYWVREGKEIDWDWWLSNEEPKMGHHSVVPEVSRTGHAGSAGAHVSGFRQVYYFHNRVQSLGNPFGEMPTLNTKGISSPTGYYKWMKNEIKSSQKLKLTDSPCAYDIFPSNETGPFVLYLGVDSKYDKFESFYLFQACLGTDETDLKELYDGVMRLNVLATSPSPVMKKHHRHILYLVGCPLSSFCEFSENKSDWIFPPPKMLDNIRTIAFWRRNTKLSDINV